MKWFLLLVMAGAAGAIFYFRDEIRGKIEKSTSSSGGGAKEEVVASGTGSGGGSKPGAGSNGGGTGGSSKINPSGKKPAPVDPVNPHPREEDDEVAKRYPMPKFKTIEQAVANWKAIPSNAFPRQIVVNKAIKVVLPGGVGSSTWPANSQAYALRAQNGMLTVGKTKNASVRGQVGIDDTNYKEVLTKEFEAWKTRQEKNVMKQRERARSVMAQTKAASGPTPSRNLQGLLAYEKELGKIPEQRPNGEVPIMLASMKRGDVSEIKPEIIEGWGSIIREEVDGKAYWTATVEYKTVSMFGELNTEAQALMLNRKVIKWIYTGSGESVP